MGRLPCCEKVGLKKGPWTPEEDQKLLVHIEEHGHGSWRVLPVKAGLPRCGKSCRLRWTNYLRPDIKRGKFSLHEEQSIIQLHALLGNRWSAIATHLPKRTDNEIKNYWNTHLKKRLAKMGIDPVTHKPKSDALGSTSGHSKSVANLSHVAQWESARLEAEARLVRESKLRSHPSNSVWRKPTACNLGVNNDLESPTSTLNFSENTGPTVGLIDGESGMFSMDTMLFDKGAPWLPETSSMKSGSSGGSGFTGMLLGNSDEQNSLDRVGDSDNLASDSEEESNEYWNSLLDLVNSSTPANSPPPAI